MGLNLRKNTCFVEWKKLVRSNLLLFTCQTGICSTPPELEDGSDPFIPGLAPGVIRIQALQACWLRSILVLVL